MYPNLTKGLEVLRHRPLAKRWKKNAWGEKAKAQKNTLKPIQPSLQPIETLKMALK